MKWPKLILVNCMGLWMKCALLHLPLEVTLFRSLVAALGEVRFSARETVICGCRQIASVNCSVALYSEEDHITATASFELEMVAWGFTLPLFCFVQTCLRSDSPASLFILLSAKFANYLFSPRSLISATESLLFTGTNIQYMQAAIRLSYNGF